MDDLSANWHVIAVLIILWTDACSPLRKRRAQQHRRKSNGSGTQLPDQSITLPLMQPYLPQISNIQIYMLCMAISDFLVAAQLPLLIYKQYYSEWPFGSPLCKLYYLTDSTCRLISSFLLATLSVDRCFAVWKPHIWARLNATHWVPVVACLGCYMVANVIATPVAVYADVHPYTMMYNNTTALGADEIIECDISSDMGHWFIYYAFMFYYMLPTTVIVLSYGTVARCIYKQQMRLTQENRHFAGGHQRARKVTLRVLFLTLFYMCCWTPHWLLNMAAELRLISAEHRDTAIFSVVSMFAYMLPYFNSTANPLLYTVLNNEIRRQLSAARGARRQSNGYPLQDALSGRCLQAQSGLASQHPRRATGSQSNLQLEPTTGACSSSCVPHSGTNCLLHNGCGTKPPMNGERRQAKLPRYMHCCSTLGVVYNKSATGRKQWHSVMHIGRKRAQPEPEAAHRADWDAGESTLDRPDSGGESSRSRSVQGPTDRHRTSTTS